MNREPAAEEIDDAAGRRPRANLHRGAPPVHGARVVTGILPTGRVLWFRIRPAPAPLAEVNRLLETAAWIGERRDAAVRARSAAIARLSRTLTADSDRLSRARLVGRRKVQSRLLASSAKLDRRVTKELAEVSAESDKLAAQQRTFLRRMARRNFWDNMVLLSALPLFAAYGRKGNPLDPNNLALTISLLVWLVGDEITDLLANVGSRSDSLAAIRDTDLWSVLSPFANLLTGWFLMRNGQHERFISDFANAFQPSAVAPARGAVVAGLEEHIFQFEQQIDLAPLIAPDHFPDFQGFSDVRVVAGVASVTWPAGLGAAAAPRIAQVTAKVAVGAANGLLTSVLTINATAVILEPPAAISRPVDVLPQLSVAWILDTTEPPKT